MSLIPRYEFDKYVKRYNGNRYAIGFKCRGQFLVMSFAQFTDQVSLHSSWTVQRQEGRYGIPAKQETTPLESILIRTDSEKAFLPTRCGFS